MKIIRVLNTNSVLTTDEYGREIVLLGSGLGFKQKTGDVIDEKKIEKRFVLENQKYQKLFQEMINNIPQEYIMVAEQIITLARTSFDMKLGESIHISLAEHIYTSIDNYREGITIPNTLLLEIKRYYSKEYSAAIFGLQLILEKFGCKLPEDEAGFIAMHFVNAQSNTQNLSMKNVIKLIDEINHLIIYELNANFDEESLSYYRYMTHLKFFASRVVENVHYDNDELGLFNAVKIKYPKEYACSKKVAQFIKRKYQYTVNKDETLYLTVHLSHLTNLSR